MGTKQEKQEMGGVKDPCRITLDAGETVIVTGAAGFIGAFLCKRLLEETEATVIGLDNLNDYYDVRLKEERLRMVAAAPGASRRFRFVRGDIADDAVVSSLVKEVSPTVFVNLAAQAGVRYSIDHPRSYLDANLIGFFNVLEACRHSDIRHLVFASSSSVYGLNSKVPYAVEDKTDRPVSLYASTKKANELMAHAYANLYRLPCTGLRFFTVYGPMGRPDMAYFTFTNKIVAGDPIQIYNMGNMKRDFTYVDDIVTGVMAIMRRPAPAGADDVPCAVYNIGNSHPEDLLGFVETLERVLMEEGVAAAPTAHELLPMQPGDVYQTYADVSALERDFGLKPRTSLEDGLRSFVRWYGRYYHVKA